MFRWANPTGQMQGTFLEWTDKHTESFQSLLTEVGQVCILIETKIDEFNPYGFEKISASIITALGKLNYVEGQQYIIMQVPNITKAIND
ncbi:MAG: hypothetical protein CMD92_01950 [Gammaproteobacteria bacterium]|nr:hypothetical protein [Gammaproteobacteria bacterium]|tara:strand:- start:36 stop:302 length:267 start_codon:yes stop_codon:yes gene_type:complete